jgi:hypothetical protein
MRVLQAWMGHRDYRTTLIYADYEPGDEESGLVDAAFSSPLPQKVHPRFRISWHLSQLRDSLATGGS